MNISSIVNQKHFSKIYMASVLAVSALYTTTEMVHAATESKTDRIEGCKDAWIVPEPLLKVKSLIGEPVTWIQWITAITLPFILILIFLKIKSAKGRPEKIEDGMRALYWTLGIDLAILSITWTAGWALGKIC